MDWQTGKQVRQLVVAVCTRQRPQMLRSCLASVAEQPVPDRWQHRIVVIENDPRPTAGPVVDQIAAETGCAIDYHHQPRLGIPVARNTAVEVALDKNADWIAFVDDDETVARDWVAQMVSQIERGDRDVVEGAVYFEVGEESSPWITDRMKYSFPEGSQRDRASTANVAFARRLVAAPPHGLGLRFDETLRFTGGSDTDFFLRAYKQGAVIRWSERPKAYEHLPASRLTFRWQMGRIYRIAANESQRCSRSLGIIAAARQYGLSSPKMVIDGILGLSLAPLRIFGGRERFRRKALKNGRRLAMGLGYLVGLTPFRPKPYARVDGA